MCVISAKTDQAFKEFLDARNPTKQHSSTLESYLIKPVQRVLKYPLLLRELVSLTDADSEEHYHLTGREPKTFTCTPMRNKKIRSHLSFYGVVTPSCTGALYDRSGHITAISSPYKISTKKSVTV